MPGIKSVLSLSGSMVEIYACWGTVGGITFLDLIVYAMIKQNSQQGIDNCNNRDDEHYI